jgi:hypothetical protein
MLSGAPAVRADEESKAGKRATPRVPLAWRDRIVLTKRLNEACDAVERACEAKFTKRPTLRVSDAETLKKLLVADFRETKALRGQDQAAIAELLSTAVVGYYDDDQHAIHVAPGNAEHLAELQGDKVAPGEDVLRVLLAHEATHALDWERFPLEKAHHERATADGMLAVTAVAEGHAQWVAERVAAEWGLARAFAELTRLIVAPPADLTDAQRQQIAPLLATATFAYVNGHAFMKAVSRAQGRGGIEAALSDPPTTTRDIEDPARWLARRAAPSAPDRDPDLGAVLGDLSGLVGDGAWNVDTDRVLTTALRTQEPKLRPEDRKRYLDGYEDGRVAVGRIEGEDVMVIAMALLFATPEQAATHVTIEGHTIMAQKGEVSPGMEIVSTDLTPGAGPDSSLSGFAVRREMRSAATTVLIQIQIASVGRVVLEVVVANVPSLGRAAQDQFFARAALRVTDPDAAAKAPALEPPAYVRTSSRSLTVRIVGPDGQPVPRVHLAVAPESEPDEDLEIDVLGGEHTLALPKEPGFRVSVWGAHDAEGEPLPFAPRFAVKVDEDAREVEVRLEPGVEIRGKVVDGAGSPVARVTVEARANVTEGNRTRLTNRVCGRVATGPDGTFRVIGVDGGAYRLRLMRDGKEASVGETPTRGGADGVQVVLRPSRAFQLTVLDADGAPVPHARVQVSQHAGRNAFAMGETDERGRVTLEGLDPAERGWLEITPPETAPTMGLLDRFGWELKEEAIRLPRGRAVLVRVVNAEGRPTKGRVMHRINRGKRTSHKTDDEGRFTILHVPVGPARLAAVADRGAGPGKPDSVPEPQSPEWTLVMADQSEITLTIQAPRKPGDPTPPQDFEEDEPPRGGKGWELEKEEGVEAPPEPKPKVR